ncbi:MAG TPA: peptidoglycan recognition family protein [Solirubrobacterales bacterium]|nr:peptidoglycan recognition family protein [Solirubrobacterales bacterium]
MQTATVIACCGLLAAVGGDQAGAFDADSISAAHDSDSRASKPPIRNWPIPFGPKRKHETAAYSQRHYRERTWRLRQPRVIVEHMAEVGSPAGVFNTFAPDIPDPELGELPNVCAHFVVSSSGRIFRLVNLRTRCRHTVGLNWTAIGIEHTGYADADAIGNRRQMHASLRLTQYLRCRFGIRVRDVIGHAESLTSPYHRERVPNLRQQTHGDWRHSSMQIYRYRLRTLGQC